MRHVLRTAVGIIAIAALAGRTPAQSPSAVVARDSGATLERLAEGVYAITHADAILSFPDGGTDWPHSNVGVVVGSSGVLVIDTDFSPSRAAADIALIRRVTKLPVRYVVNTHWHGDHTHGNAVYADSFPGVIIAGSRDNAGYIGINQARYPRSSVAPGSAARGVLAGYEATLAHGADSTGRPLRTSERMLLTRVIGQWRRQLHEFTLVRPAPPTMLFDTTLSIDLGGRRVELVNRGHANSPSDVTVYVPAQRVLFTGDIVVWPVPYTFDAYPTHWIRVLRDLERIPAATIVPGHGSVFTDFTYVRQLRELLEHAVGRADSLIRTGMLRPQIERAVDLSDRKARFVRPGNAGDEAMWQAAIESSLMERVYQCLVGSRC